MADIQQEEIVSETKEIIEERKPSQQKSMAHETTQDLKNRAMEETINPNKIPEEPTPEEWALLRSVFDHFDKDQGGTISRREWTQALTKHPELMNKFFGVSATGGQRGTFDAIDSDGEGDVSWDEFVESANRYRTDVALPLQKGLAKSVDYMVTQFITEKELGKMHKFLATKFSDQQQSASSAIELFKHHGVNLSEDEEKRLMGLAEPQMIEALVAKMPNQSKEQFQQFFLQLQLLVQTSSRVYSALEEGDAAEMTSCLDDAEEAGILPFILKMAITQAGAKAMSVKYQQKLWMRDTSDQMEKMVRNQNDAFIAKKRVQAARLKLSGYQDEATQKSRKVLMNMNAGNTAILLKTMIQAWVGFVKQEKISKVVYEEYKDEIDKANQALMQCKADRLKSVRNVLAKKAAGKDHAMIAECYSNLQKEIEWAKQEAKYLEEKKALDERMAAFSASQRDNAKKVMSKMAAGKDAGLVAMVWQAWIGDVAEGRKDKELKDRIKAQEERTKEFMKGKSDNAKGLLNNMSGGSDSGLVHMVFSAWMGWFKDIMEANKMQEILTKRSNDLAEFNGRNKGGAMSAMEKAAYLGDLVTITGCFQNWCLDAKVTALERQAKVRLESKKAQLKKVQDLFRAFATRLESGIKSSFQSDNDFPAGGRSDRQKKKMSNSVSLPNIPGAYPQDADKPVAPEAA